MRKRKVRDWLLAETRQELAQAREVIAGLLDTINALQGLNAASAREKGYLCVNPSGNVILASEAPEGWRVIGEL